MTDQLAITTDADGRTVLEPDTSRSMDERDPQRFTQDRLFTPVATMAGQLTLEA